MIIVYDQNQNRTFEQLIYEAISTYLNPMRQQFDASKVIYDFDRRYTESLTNFQTGMHIAVYGPHLR